MPPSASARAVRILLGQGLKGLVPAGPSSSPSSYFLNGLGAWAVPAGASPGTTNHAALANLRWSLSGHTAAPYSIPWFGPTGSATTLPGGGAGEFLGMAGSTPTWAKPVHSLISGLGWAGAGHTSEAYSIPWFGAGGAAATLGVGGANTFLGVAGNTPSWLKPDHAQVTSLGWTISGHTSTAWGIAAFDGSGAARTLALTTDVNLAGNTDTNIASERAVRGYVDARALAATTTISTDTTLGAQYGYVSVTAAAKVTLQAVSSMVLGLSTLLEYRGASPVTVEVIANAADKIEGATKVGIYGSDIAVILTPFAANKVSAKILRGLGMWEVCRFDLTTASGGSPWTIADNWGNNRTFTDISTAGSAFAASSGLQATAANGTAFYGALAGTAAAVRTPLGSLTDAWGRTLGPWDELYLLAKSSKTTVVAGSTPTTHAALGGSAMNVAPRIGSNNDQAGTLTYKAYDTASRSVNLTPAAPVTVAHWHGMEWDPHGRRLRHAVLTTQPSGNPAVDWWPWTYDGGDGIAVGQDFWGSTWSVPSLTNAIFGQTNSTTGSKYTWTVLSLLRVERGLFGGAL